MNTGTVKWFNASKGYGFVEPSDKSRDVFFPYLGGRSYRS